MSSFYRNAVISVEDHRYYDHGPVDFIAIGRAIFTNIKSGQLKEGGSTITQQVAKNNYFTQEKTLERKVAEMFMAFKLEKELKKEKILELYLNSSYFGSGYYTIKDASIGYFKKNPNKMTASESIMLAGVLNAPSAYAPNKNLSLAKKREQHVLRKLIKYGYLTKKEADDIYHGN